MENLNLLYNRTLQNVQGLMVEGVSEIERAKIKGKSLEYHDAMKWMIDNYQGDLKFVRVEDFLKMLRVKGNIEQSERVVNNAEKKQRPVDESEIRFN